MKIGNLDTRDKVMIVAEIGNNHEGSVELGRQLVDKAADAGVDAVKFQTFKATSLVSQNASKADYQKKAGDASESQYDMLKKLELDKATHQELMSYCKEKSIMFLCR